MLNKDFGIEFFSSRKEARDFKKVNGGKLYDLTQKPKLPESELKFIEEFISRGYDYSRWVVVVHIFATEQVSLSSLEDKPTSDNSLCQVDYSKTIVIITPQNVAVTLSDGTQHNVNREKGQFSKVVELALQEQYEDMMEYVSLANAVKVFTFGSDIKIEGGVLYYNNAEIDSTIAQRIVNEATTKDGNVERYVNFFRKLQRNPSYKAVQHTYDFMVHNDLQILPNGDIKAWKSVNVVDEVPVAAKRVPNWKGTTIEMPRNQVEDNPNVTCSHGLHIASREYAENYAELLLEVSVSPEDIVSVPVDYKNQKCRCCKYTILTGMEAPEGTTKYLLIDKNSNVL